MVKYIEDFPIVFHLNSIIAIFKVILNIGGAL